MVNKEQTLLQFLSCYAEPVSIREFYEVIKSWQLYDFHLNIKEKDIEIAFKNEIVSKIANQYIIKDVILREKYFYDLLNSNIELFSIFTDEIVKRYSNYDRTLTKIRISLYQNTDNVINTHNNFDKFYDYIDEILQNFYKRTNKIILDKYIITKMFAHKILFKLFNLKSIENDFCKLKEHKIYWNEFIKNYHEIYFYNSILRGNITELTSIIAHNNIIYIAISEVLKGNYNKAITIFKEELKQIRKYTSQKNPIFPIEIHSFAFILSLIKYPKYYTPLHNSLYKVINEYHKTMWHSFLYENKLKNKIIKSGVYSIDSDIHNGIISILEIIMYSWLNVIEDWETTSIEYIATKALNNGFNWAGLELSYILKHSVNNPENWSKIYKKLKKEIPDVIPLASLVKFKNKKEFILSLIEDDIKNSVKKQQNPKKEKKILWILKKDYDKDLVIFPYYQKLLSSGKYSSIKELPRETLRKLYNQNNFLSQSDFLLLKKMDYYIRAIKIKDITENLINMDNIFNDYDIDNNIVFEKGKFPITIYDSEKGYHLKLDKNEISELMFIKENDYLYKIVKPEKNTLILLNELKKKGLNFSFEEKDILLKWIENNNTLDIKASFYYPENVEIKKLEQDIKVVYDIDFDKQYFNIDIKISPAPNWALYTPNKKGITIIHKDENNNYFMIKRNIAKEKELIKKINNKFKITPDENTWKFKTRGHKKIINILEKSEKTNTFEVRWKQKGKRKKLKKISGNDINWKIKDKNNWFEIDGFIEFNENEKLLLNELLAQKNKSFFVLKSGDIVNITNELKENLKKIKNSTVNKENKLIIPPYFTSEVNEIIEIGKIIERSEKFKESLEKFKILENTNIKIPPNMEILLRNYQKEGVKWIVKMTNSGFGVCLADDMGLGKTIQTIIAISMAPQKSIIIAPASVLYNWKAEFEKFAPQLNPIIYEGNNKIFKKLTKNTMIIISYDKFQREQKLFHNKNWGFIILDEAQMIKNATTKRAKAIFEINAEKRIALSGTPIENHLGELWSLFHFLNPVLLGSKQMFNDFFVKPINNKNEEVKSILREMIDPFLLRRLKKDVLKELPDKTEIIHYVNFESKEKAYYEAQRRKALKELKSSNSKAGTQRIKILAHLTKLRQLACDMALIKPDINEESSKTQTAVKLIEDIISGNHKVLIFSQFTSYLSIIKNVINKKNIKYLYLDGSTKKKDRQELVNKFQKEQNIKVFLISLKAGGTGLNLTTANYVIHLDPWWNPAVEDQATDRTHRIGQDKQVTVYKLITKNSIEEKIIKLHENKKELSNSILDGMGNVNTKLSIDDLMALL